MKNAEHSAAAIACAQALTACCYEGYVAGTWIKRDAPHCFFGLRRRRGAVVVSDLWVSPTARGIGHGSALLDWVCNTADAHAVPLLLRAHAFDRRGQALSTPRLRAWYARYGFVPTRGEWMRRMPAKGAFA